ncbi:carboxypeptidase M32 [archaeon]|jgi:carboxypeptidase Taq|nr:carboxypeptidase M32 [archaeon]MBT6697964.1 carboxypeptidase M32 [archaeon]
MIKEYLKTINTFEKELSHLGAISALLQWDQQTIMPKAASAERAEQSAYISTKIHQTFLNKKFITAVNKLSNQVNFKKLSKNNQTRIKHLKKDQDKNKKIPLKHVEEYSKLTSLSHHKWVDARNKENTKLFLPTLTKVVNLKLKEIKYLDPKGIANHPYDILLDDFEEGMTVEKIDPIFEELKFGIIQILNKIKQSKPYKTRKDILANKKYKFPKEIQLKVTNEIASLMNPDTNRFTIAESVHPFTTRISFNDTRLTTAVRENQPMFSFTSLSHEAGHAQYEMGMGKNLKNTSLQDCPTVGLHESQSRIWENQVTRSFDFWQFYYPKYQKHFPTLKSLKLKDFYESINIVKPSLVRIECDELTYCLHVIIRYELEKDLIAQKIKAKDLEKKWNQKYQEYLGVKPNKPSRGVLQDVHWSEGYFGYFPTYALGTLYSAMLWKQINIDNKQLKKQIKKGNIKYIKDWLDKKIHVHGKTKTTEQIIKLATKQTITAKPFLNYLKDKYYPLYNIKE